jgi:hypothetical protein
MSFVQGKGFVHDAGGSVTPAALVTAAEGMTSAQEAAFRGAVGTPADVDLADFARGQHRLPLANTRAWWAGRFPQTDCPPISLLVYGDSLSSAYFDSANPRSLIRGMSFAGFRLMSLEWANVTAGSAPRQFGGDWLINQFRSLAGSTTVEWNYTIRANRVSIAYLRGAGNSTVTLQFSQNNGSTWTTAATINTASAVNEFTFSQFTLPFTMPTRVRVGTAAGHAAKVIGCGLWVGDEGNFQGEGGYTIVAAARDGLELSESLTATSATTWATLFSAAKINAVIGTWNDFASNWDVGGTVDQLRARADAGRVADWVFVSTISGDSDVPGAPDAVDLRAQREAQRAWAARTGQNFIDFAGFLRDSFAYAVSIGAYAAGDTIHPAAFGYTLRQHIVSEALAHTLKGVTTTAPQNRIDLGFGFQIVAGPFAVALESTGQYTGGWAITGAGASLAVASQTDANPWRQLTFACTGSESVGMTFGWTTNRDGFNSARTPLQWTATGNSDATNLETVSSYPLVNTTRRVNAEPATPAAGSIKEYWHVNGSSKWEKRVKTPAGTVHIIWTEP